MLTNHLQLTVEADAKRSLSRGVNGLSVRLARAVNRLAGRRGKVFADHYHSRLLRTPTQVANAIRYVHTNAEHHYGERGIDPYSSRHLDAGEAVAEAIGWLLRVGWLRWATACDDPRR